MTAPIERVALVSTPALQPNDLIATAGRADPAAVAAFQNGVNGIRPSGPSEAGASSRVVFGIPAEQPMSDGTGAVYAAVDEIRAEMNTVLRSALAGFNSTDASDRLTAEMTRTALLTIQMTAITSVSQNVCTGVQTILKQAN